ncbi:hypothetical protein TI39_contig414g00010 [Zymoseptoria brevis]|uniref:Uncharacterized protein n=1 Tax=Zymoseptoria brevis TaxID=1047168 RepID=A0A0F4GLS9_9PEZI|nr:hypothetical protein TI39_contig414g00010 [Zymoseptoria brevis]
MDTPRLQSEEIAPLGSDIRPQILRRSSEIKAKNETSTPTNPTEQPQDYARASFMGLPVEMRMRIYGFLVNGGRVMDPGCAGSGCVGHGQLKCHCTESVWPQILATNSVIFMEAMPVLYSTTEFHVGFPRLGQSEPTLPSCRTALSASPKYGAPHIRRLALCAILEEMSIAVCRGETQMDDLSLHWIWLSSLDLNLVCVRLYLIASPARAMTCRHVDVTPFVGLLSTCQVRKILVQIPCNIDENIDPDSGDSDVDVEDENGVRTNKLRDKLLAALRKKAEQLDHRPKIIDISDKLEES